MGYNYHFVYKILQLAACLCENENYGNHLFYSHETKIPGMLFV